MADKAKTQHIVLPGDDFDPRNPVRYISLHNEDGTEWEPDVDTLILGETSTTAYRGDRGKTAYDHSQLISGNPHGLTKATLGLGNVDNTSDVNKPVSTATQAAIDAASAALLVFNPQSANYTIAASDHLKQIEWSKSTAGTLTVPKQATTPISVGFITTIRVTGAGQLTVTPEDGAVILQSADSKLKSRVQYAKITLAKVATNTWDVTGDLAT